MQKKMNDEVMKKIMEEFQTKNEAINNLLRDEKRAEMFRMNPFKLLQDEKIFSKGEINKLINQICTPLNIHPDKLPKHVLKTPTYGATAEDTKYIPPTKIYTNKWDMVMSAFATVINAAFNNIYKSGSIEFHKSMSMTIKGTDITVKLSGKIPDITICNANGSAVDLNIVFEKIDVVATSTDEKAVFSMLNMIIKMNVELTSVVVTTENSSKELSVYLNVGEKDVINSMSVTVDEPEILKEKIGRFAWEGIMSSLSDFIIALIHGNDNERTYKLFSVDMTSDVYEQNKGIIPQYANFGGAQSALPDPEDKLKSYQIAAFCQTINSVSEELMVDIPSSSILTGANGMLAVSQQVAMQYLFCQAFNVEAKENGYGNDLFLFVNNGNDMYITTKCAIKKEDGAKQITIDNIRIRMIDDGFHLEGDITIVCAYISKIEGKFTTKAILSKDSKTNKFMVNVCDPYLDTNLSLNWLGYIIAFILGCTGIGLIIDAIGAVTIAVVNGMLEWNPEFTDKFFDFKSFPIQWNGASVAKFVSIEVSNGIKAQLIFDIATDK